MLVAIDILNLFLIIDGSLNTLYSVLGHCLVNVTRRVDDDVVARRVRLVCSTAVVAVAIAVAVAAIIVVRTFWIAVCSTFLNTLKLVAFCPNICKPLIYSIVVKSIYTYINQNVCYSSSCCSKHRNTCRSCRSSDRPKSKEIQYC